MRVIKRNAVLCLAALFLAASIGCTPKPNLTPAPQPIHGYVVTAADVVGANVGGATGIELPDVEVVAKNMSTGVSSAPVRTDPFGYFRTPLVAAGSYQI